ncbi:hypothetical protein [Amaricoccus sp.]|uniref:hypothetical protein n=1 Tax=Amaricoccus sp. TaxID=1872485 RepID=UPI001B4681AF|nr:hypothetical protein [Amaricoccus sp.]MBP7003640.1 hypothetical protein [Amaricoccus sp.]
MTTITCTGARPRFLGGLLAIAEAARRRFEAARARARDREVLRRFADMDDSLLADIGLTRGDLARIARDTGVSL